MIYELRRYQCVPGKMAALHNMMTDVALEICERHGIKLLGAWETMIGDTEQTYVCLYEFNGMDERNAKWDAFFGDPDWQSARAEIAKRDGQFLVSSSSAFLKAAPYSPIR